VGVVNEEVEAQVAFFAKQVLEVEPALSFALGDLKLEALSREWFNETALGARM
jgi:hypothetical protein